LDGVAEAFLDATDLVDGKWERAFAKADRVRDGFRWLIGDPAAEIALGASTHELIVRFLSALDLRARPRLVTTDAEFHTLRRQLGRLGEEGIEVVRVPARPVEDLAARLAAAIDERTAAVLVSAVLFEDARIVPGLSELAGAAPETEVLIDVYHALGAVPFTAPPKAWIVGGGYKYLQMGEGNCFLRVPDHARDWRPVVTGWYAEFDFLDKDAGCDARIPFSPGAAAFAGATYDPVSHYRGARVLDFFAEQGLTPDVLRESYLAQLSVLAAGFDALAIPDELVWRDRDTPLEGFGGFLALRCERAGELSAALATRGVHSDSRGTFLRFGPAPYLSEEQLERAIAELGTVLTR
jgi:kynureninase